MPIPAPFVSRAMDIEKDWIDYNGHLNMAYYNVLFDRCSDEAFEMMGMGLDYAKERRLTIYTAEVHVCYVQELHLDAPGHGHLPAHRPRRQAAAGLPGDPPRRRLARRHLRNAVAACRHGGPEGRPSPPMCWPRWKRCAPPMRGLPMPERAGRSIGIKRKPG